MVIVSATQKGGVGKTTAAAVLAQAAAHNGARVLAIDIDPQANLSFALGAKITRQGGNSYKLLTGEPATDQIQTTEQEIDVIPANPALATITSGKGTARRLQEAIKVIREQYDIITIDTPPAAGELQYNALQAADRLIIPLLADSYSLQGLYQITETARMIQKSNPDLQIAGIFLNQFAGTTTLEKQIFREIINTGVGKMGLPYLGSIRNSNHIAQAASLQASLYKHAPRSAGAKDYMDMFTYITDYKFT